MEIPIASPPWSPQGKMIESAIRKAILHFSLLEPETKKIAIALSGGKDSLSLLYMLHAIRGRGVPFFELCAIHVEGEFSCGAGVDAPFLQKICERLGIAWVCCRSEQTRAKLECYSCARERRRLLFHAAKEAGITTIAFGHHRDDSAQTLLLNLFQKGEFAANLPRIYMQRYGVTIIRPLIYVPEKMLKRFAQENGFARITCQCPVGQNSRRKEVDNVLQRVEEFFPHVRKNIFRAGLLYGSDKAANP